MNYHKKCNTTQIEEAYHRLPDAIFCFPLFIPLGRLPALAQLALLAAHHVEVPLLAVTMAATN